MDLELSLQRACIALNDTEVSMFTGHCCPGLQSDILAQYKMNDGRDLSQDTTSNHSDTNSIQWSYSPNKPV